MKQLISDYMYNIKVKKRNLETKRITQAAENEKELVMLMSQESMLEELMKKEEEE